MHQLKQVTETRCVKTQFDLPLSTLPQQYRAWHRTRTGSEKKVSMSPPPQLFSGNNSITHVILQ